MTIGTGPALHQLDPLAFQHLANALALRVLGAGLSTFSPGPDGGRDGYFEGEAPYPSKTSCWRGRWYIQSKYHAPHLSADPQRWLLQQIAGELDAFADPASDREWPDNWILVTNVDPSAVPRTGTFDKAVALVRKRRPSLASRFHIWGASKVTDLLSAHLDVAQRYGHFLTPGHVLTQLIEQLSEDRPSLSRVIKHLVVSALEDHQHTKLEQAGSEVDDRPGIHRLFVDLPWSAPGLRPQENALRVLLSAAAENHLGDSLPGSSEHWRRWRSAPTRAPVWFIKGGPGQGKSTLGQYFCQLLRAHLIISNPEHAVHAQVRELAEEIRKTAERDGLWPSAPRIPLHVELKDYAQWFATRPPHSGRGVLSFIAAQATQATQQDVTVGLLRRALLGRRWAVVFDGLDEVPADTKDDVAKEIRRFLADESSDADLFALCTSRPQGYSGEFDKLHCCAFVHLVPLPPETALACSERVIALNRSSAEAANATQTLRAAMSSPAIQELMTTPLQAHIIAVIVRGGQRPPSRKWELYHQFYEVIRAREANRGLADSRIAEFFHEEPKLLRQVHNRLGFVLQARAERAEGAKASLPRSEFCELVEGAVRDAKDDDQVAGLVEIVMKASTERLVLINTPDEGAAVRFDIRPLQEFFAAEYIYEGASPAELRARLEHIAGDAHWREVTHFLLSALAEGNRRTELAIAIDVLRSLDEAPDESDAVLRRVLARGGTAAARLLEDGVLEQDKMTRNAFVDCVASLASVHDADACGPLFRIQGSASRTWVTNLMLRRVGECAPDQALGAHMVLWHALERGDNRTERVRTYWEQMPTATVERLLSGIASPDGELKEWHAAVIAEWLVRPDAVRASHGIAWLFRAGGPVSKEFIRSLNREIRRRCGEGGIAALNVFLSMRPVPTRHLKYGSYHVSVMAPNAPTKWLTSAARGLSGAQLPGLFGLVQNAVRFAVTRNRQSYLAFLESVGPDWYPVYVLPSALWVCLAGDSGGPSEVAEVVKAMSDEEFTAVMQGRSKALRFGSPSLDYSETISPTIAVDEFRAMLDDFPDFALRFWANRALRGEIGEGPTAERDVAAVVASCVRTSPRRLRRLHPADWPPLQEADSAFRSALIGAWRHGRVPYFRRQPPLGGRLLAVDVSTEPELLPPSVAAVLCAWNQYCLDCDEENPPAGSAIGERRMQCIQALREACPSREALWTCAHGVPCAAAGAASLAGILLADAEGQDWGPWVPAFSKSCEVSPDLCAAGMLCADMLGMNPQARAFASEVLRHIDWSGHDPAPSILRSWRQRGAAPVSNSGTPSLWGLGL